MMPVVSSASGFGGERAEAAGPLGCERCGGWPRRLAAVLRRAGRGSTILACRLQVRVVSSPAITAVPDLGWRWPLLYSPLLSMASGREQLQLVTAAGGCVVSGERLVSSARHGRTDRLLLHLQIPCVDLRLRRECPSAAMAEGAPTERHHQYARRPPPTTTTWVPRES